MQLARTDLPRLGRRLAGSPVGAISVLLALSLIPLTGSPASATSVMLQGTADLAQNSDLVVTGTVTSVEARRAVDYDFIYTYVTIQVDEVFKGAPVSTVHLEELGGQVGEWIHYVPGVPHYEEGEQVLVFLHDLQKNGLYRTYGMVQGAFRFETDPATGQEILTRPGDWSETSLVAMGEVSDLSPMRADGSYAAEPMLDALREWVESH